MLRVLAFVSLPCVFVWLVELLTANHTISLSFNRYILLVCLFDKIFANGVSYRCSVEITWPCERTSNPKYHGHCGRRCGHYRTSVFHLLLMWHCCSQTKAVVVVHGELSSCDVLHIASKFSLHLCYIVPKRISQVINFTSTIRYARRGHPVTPPPDIRTTTLM